MKRAIAMVFAVALLAVSVFAVTASASPWNQYANGNGTCNGSFTSTNNGNSGQHYGGNYYCP